MQALSSDFTVRLANKEELETALDDPAMVDMFQAPCKQEALKKIYSSSVKVHLLTYNDMKLFFIFREIVTGVYDVHVACPKASRVGSRILVYAALKWIYLTGANNLRYFFTSCLEGTAANMLRKFGCAEVKRTGVYIHFMATPEMLNMV